MTQAFRIVTRIQDLDDFSGSLTNGEFISYDSALQKFKLKPIVLEPGGLTGQLQYNNTGAFGGVSFSNINASGDLLTLNSLANSDIPLVIKGTTAQSAYLTKWVDVNNNILASISSNGSLAIAGEIAVGNHVWLTPSATSLEFGWNIRYRNGDWYPTKANSYYVLLEPHEPGSNKFTMFTGATPANINSPISDWHVSFRADDDCFAIGSYGPFLYGSISNLIQIGGVTSSFPAIKQNGAAINFRLANDSADAAITTGAITTSGNITISGGNLINDPGSALHGFGHYRSVGNVFYARHAVGYMCSMNSSSTTGFVIREAYPIGWSAWAGGLDSTPHTSFQNPSTGVVQLRSSASPTTPQCFEVTGTYTSNTTQEGVRIKGVSSANFEFGPFNGSVGGTLRGLTIGGYSNGSSTITPWLTFTNTGVASFSGDVLVGTGTSKIRSSDATGFSLGITSAGNTSDNIAFIDSYRRLLLASDAGLVFSSSGATWNIQGQLMILRGSSSQIDFRTGSVPSNPTGWASIGAGSVNLSGQFINALGTITSSTPATFTQTWNSGAVTFNGMLMNITDTASASLSTFVDFQVGGVSKFSVDKRGYGTFVLGLEGKDWIRVTSDTTGYSIGSNSDVQLYRDGAADTLALRRSTNAQTFRIYNTYTSTSNYENFQQTWVSNEFRLGTSVGSLGGTQRSTVIGTWNAAGSWSPFLTITNTGAATFASSVTANFQGGYTLDNGYGSWKWVSGNDVEISAPYGLNLKSQRVTINSQAGGGLTSPSALTINAAAHTNCTASTEVNDVNFNFARTLQFATGALTTQRAFLIQAPTYAFVGASTITKAVTLSISGAPTAGTNATITNSYAFEVASGASYFGGSVWGSSFTADYGNFTNPSFIIGASSQGFGASGTTLYGRMSSTVVWAATTSEFRLGSTQSLSWASTGDAQNSGDLFVLRDAANVLAIRNSTNAQAFRIYNTYTSNTNSEYFQQSWVSNEIRLGTAVGSAGGTQRNIIIGGWDSANAWTPKIVIMPTATGAIYFGPVADSTTTGGNARGQNAIDFQRSRSNANQVASGDLAVILGGVNNRVANGYNWGTIVNGNNNTVTGASGFIGAGFSCSATNVYSCVTCGSNNAASGQNAFIGCGSYNTASATFSAIICGDSSTASGNYSVIVGGQTNTASGVLSAILNGQHTVADRYGMVASSNGKFSTNGDNQYVKFILRNKTTDATPTTLFLDGSSVRLTIPSGKIMFADIWISGIKSDGSASATYRRKVAIKNVGGTTSLVGSIETIGSDYKDNLLTNVSITADDTNDALQINVTGIAAETWRWVAMLEGIEIAYGT